MSNTMEESFVRIGWDLSKGLIESLSTFVNSYKNSSPTKADRSVKKYQKEFEGKRFNQRDKFVTQAMHKTGKTDFQQMKINNQDYKNFDRLCKQYGVDYLYESKPKVDIQALISKKDRSKYEEKLVQAWSEKDANGNIIECPDDVKITFRAQDIGKLEYVVEDMLKKKHDLKRRKEIAKVKHAKAKEVQKVKDKNFVPKR